MKLKSLVTIGLFIIILIIFILHYGHDFLLNYNKPSIEQYVKHMETHIKNKKRNHKPQVIFLLSYDYKKIPDYAVYSIHILQEYCNKHKYELIIKNHHPNETISPYWLRVHDLIQLSNQYPTDTIFVYLDIDATIHPKYFNIRIEELLDVIDSYNAQMYSIYIGRDINPVALVNTGVIFVRNNYFSKVILNEWGRQYDPSKWKKINGTWICKDEKKECKWAGDHYEQGELTNLYRDNSVDASRHIKVLHSSICSNKFLYKNSFIYHFMGKKNLSDFEYLYNQLNKNN